TWICRSRGRGGVWRRGGEVPGVGGRGTIPRGARGGHGMGGDEGRICRRRTPWEKWCRAVAYLSLLHRLSLISAPLLRHVDFARKQAGNGWDIGIFRRTRHCSI